MFYDFMLGVRYTTMFAKPPPAVQIFVYAREADTRRFGRFHRFIAHSSHIQHVTDALISYLHIDDAAAISSPVLIIFI